MMKICLDPGHYGDNYNPGVAAGYVESNFTWAYHLLLKAELQRYGAEVVVTRETKAEDLGLQARGKKAVGCDLFISIHSNAVDNKPNMDAIFTHWSVRSGGEGIAKKIANDLTTFFVNEWGHIEPPVTYEQESEKYPGYDYFGVLKGAASVEVPGIIVEHSFHTNKQYCEWAMTPGNIERMAKEEAKSIAEFYGLVEPVENDFYYIPQTVDLKKGDKGEAVKRLQMRMRQVSAEFDEEVKAHSFKHGQPDGSFGGKMVETIKKFQQYAAIPATGELDATTRYILNCDIGIMYGDLQEASGQINAIRNILK